MANQLTNHLADKENSKRFYEQSLHLEVASLIYRAMQDKGMSRSALADALGVTRGRITQYLGGELNLRLSTLANIFQALDCEVKLKTSPLYVEETWLSVNDKVQLSPYKAKAKWIPDKCLDAGLENLQLAG